MMERRIDDLLMYLDMLIRLQDSDGGYLCNKEIGECIGEIKAELGIGEYR